MSKRRRLPQAILDTLERSGLPWRIDGGKRHFRLIVGDKFVAILPQSLDWDGFKGRADRNTLAQVRRAIREQITTEQANG